MKDDFITANVLSVKVTGDAGKYQFNVEVSSPDTGCDQYADWWEVLSEDGHCFIAACSCTAMWMNNHLYVPVDQF